MTTRETTLGALTAADLGKRVDRTHGHVGTLLRVVHEAAGVTQIEARGPGNQSAWSAPATTPVTVYDEEEA